MLSKNILFIGKKFLSAPSGGREMLSALNFKLIKNIFKKDFFHYEIFANQTNIKKKATSLNNFTGMIDGLDQKIIAHIERIIKLKKIQLVFIDGSNLGLLAERIKLKFPNVKIFIFFHNIEAKFFLDSFIRAKTFHSLGVAIANYFAEKKAAKNSDYLICLTKDDARLMKKFYKNKVDLILPMALEDKFSRVTNINQDPTNKEQYVLFVGGAFYANEFGIKWFVKNVSPYINLKTFVVGSGFELLKDEFKIYKNVSVIGKVEDLSQWYLNAECIIAPIFEGSGMKTKVAEAFMFGKKILATSHALAGYEGIPKNAFSLCNTEYDFIDAINAIKDNKSTYFDANIRSIYEQKYSPASSKALLERFFQGK
jgi:hypothetical protein